VGRLRLAIAVLVPTVLGAPGASGAQTEDAARPVTGGTVVFAVGNDAAMVNPNLITSSPDLIIGASPRRPR